MRRALWPAGGAWLVAMAVLAPAASARMAAPGLQSPAAGATVQSLPAFTWGGVGGAAQYQFEFSADRGFSSGVNGFGAPGTTLNSTAITDDQTVVDGTYYWRVRGVDAKDHPGPWSGTRTLHKAWTTAPQLISPLGSSVIWPSNPLVLRWSAVPHAVGYDVWIATDPALSNLVLGSLNSPQQTQGTVFALQNSLAPATYYWAVTPVDATGARGVRSPISSFAWTWPSTTTVGETNIATDAGIVDPQFSWGSVPGAAGYQVEVNSSQDFTPGSKWCCDNTNPGTTLSPTNLLPNATYYWRVRAIDSLGDAGVWNVGQPFQESFDQVTPTVPNLQLRDVHNNMAVLPPGSPTDTPIVTWDPVPGASSYQVQITPFIADYGCPWTSAVSTTTETSNTAWTPMAGGQHVGPPAWPSPDSGTWVQSSAQPETYCLRVLARRDDGAPGGGQIVSDWTQLGGFNTPAFVAEPPLTSSGLTQPTSNQYLLPINGSTTVRNPLFTWSQVTGANGYYVVVARDQSFTDVVDVGFTDDLAWAPQIPYLDETTAYWWAAIPSADAGGSLVNTDPEYGQDNPQTFDKSSVPPSPVSPTGGANAGLQPTFRWTAAEGARNYVLQVSADPSFANPLLVQTTDSTAFTTTSTLPADVTLYWRVSADNADNEGLNWSPVSTFTHVLPVPSPSPGNPTSGDTIPLLTWSAVPDALSYDAHVDQADGSTRDFNVTAPALAPTQFYGTGIWRWQVRADFPGGNSAVSAYFAPEQQYVRSIPAPTGVSATKSGLRILLSWTPDQVASKYQVQLSTTDGFASPVASDQTVNTAWVPQIDAATAAERLYWRVAAIDSGGNVGAYAGGVFNPPARSHKRHKSAKSHKSSKHHKSAKSHKSSKKRRHG